MKKKQCCEVFELIAKELKWFSYEDDEKKKVYIMPYLKGSDNAKYKVKHCPSCGVNVKSISFTQDEFDDL